MDAAAPTPDAEPAFVTVKVRPELRRWLKAKAALRGMTMYALLEELLRKGWGGGDGSPAPWEMPSDRDADVDAALDR